MTEERKILVEIWIRALLVLVVLIFMGHTMGCFQHELKYDYYLRDPNSLHVESLRYKQNGLGVKTDKWMIEAAFADVIKVKMDRSTQVPDPNTVEVLKKALDVAERVVGI